mmetsp:Transcript_18219/g.45957  ORF Transcript_18219/g.45957 Transcript_18219/m.45957 type:complete len:280 (+) Transcript_18219:1106-1945(+)
MSVVGMPAPCSRATSASPSALDLMPAPHSTHARSPALKRYLNSVTGMEPPAVATSTNSRNAPGRSGMVVVSVASVVAPTLANSATSLRRSKFMLAPDVTATTVLPVCPFALSHALAPATPTAPAGSRMERVSLNTSLMAALMALLSTSTTPSTSCRHSRKVSMPTCLTATPSANASTRDSATRSPRCRLSAIALAPVGSTPMILMCGCSTLVYAAMPATRPPPPMGTKMASRRAGSPTWRRISSPMVPCPATTSGASYGGTNVSPSAADLRTAYACVSW